MMSDTERFKRQIRGARSKRNGKLFEDLVTASCHYYASRRTALIIKTPEPMKPIKDLGSGRFIAYYEKAAQPDYKGVMRGGRTVIFDAKHTDTDRLEQKAVTDAQAAMLTNHEQFGAICFILISFGFQRYYRVPWQVFKQMKENFGRKYIKPGDLDKYKVEYMGGVIKFLEREEKAYGFTSPVAECAPPTA